MTDKEILSSVLKLIPQMTKGTGHFHYSVESNDGRVRRIKLAKELYSKGLR